MLRKPNPYIFYICKNATTHFTKCHETEVNTIMCGSWKTGICLTFACIWVCDTQLLPVSWFLGECNNSAPKRHHIIETALMMQLHLHELQQPKGMGARYMTRGIFFCLFAFLPRVAARKSPQAPKNETETPEIQQFVITWTVLKIVKSWPEP